jgi:hypothetical protein
MGDGIWSSRKHAYVFSGKIAKDPSFQYALQIDQEEQIANIF